MTDGAFMFQDHDGSSKDAGTPVPASACGAAGGVPARSCSNTRVTEGERQSGFLGVTADGTEHVRMLATGKSVKTILTPIPLQSAHSRVAHVDWLSFTFSPPESDHSFIPQILQKLAELFGVSAVQGVDTGSGWQGYARRINLVNAEGVNIGLIAYGGKRQRGTIHVSLAGKACALVKDWDALRAWGELLGARITRIDLAHDDFEGKTFTMEKMVDWYKQGQFNCGGRQPSHSVQGDWFTEHSPAGRTLNIGKQENGKMLCIYEKGKEQGDSQSPWVRVELRLRGDSRVIPWECLVKPGNYLAGSYRCLNFLSLIQDKIRTISKAVTISYARAVENARQMVGKLVNVMMMVSGGDAFAVVSELKRTGYPERLSGYADHIPQILAGGLT